MNINNKKFGKVYLIGAGPGDPELLTLKAKKTLEKSDVVIYDALVNPTILNFCNSKTELIKVGKRKGKHTYSQSQISELLIKKSLEFANIIRLKGGDPFIFGRGGEELRDLLSYEIRVEVIPGITAAMACAAYTYFPLTHRQWNSSVSFITGTKANNNNITSIQGDNTILESRTIVIYMALHNLSWIISKFIEAGQSLETPIMLVQCCSLPRQKTLIGTLGTIVDQIYEINFAPPSIAIVGDLVEIASITTNFLSVL